MSRQEGRVQLEQSDKCLAMNVDQMAKGGVSRAAIEQHNIWWSNLMQKPNKERNIVLSVLGLKG